MSRLLILILLALAPASRAEETGVLPEFRFRIPNGLTTVAAHYPGTDEVHLALMVPVGAAEQSSSLPGLAHAVAHHRATPPGAAPPLIVETGAEWSVFRIAGAAEDLDRLADRLAVVIEAGAEHGEPPRAGGAEACRDALYAALYPGHPLGNPLSSVEDPGALVVRGLARYYSPGSSVLLVVGDGDLFDTARRSSAPFKGWPVSSTTPTESPPVTAPVGGDHEVPLPAGASPMLLVGGRAPGPADPVVRLVALQIMRDRAAARWAAESLPGRPPEAGWLDGQVWAFGPHATDSARSAGDAIDALRGMMDDLAGRPVGDEEVLSAVGKLEAARTSAAGVGPAGHLGLMIEARRRGSSASVALEAGELRAVSIDDVRTAVGALAASPIVTVRGRPR